MLQAHFYPNTFFGDKNTKKNIITIRGNMSNGVTSKINKNNHIILVIDTSGSMTPYLSNIKATLATFHDIIGDSFGKEIKLTLITFNSEAKIIYSNVDNQNGLNVDFKTVIDNITCMDKTNLGDALTITFNSVVKNIPNWIYFLSDGMPNEGFLITSSSVKAFIASKAAPNIVIHSLGYGEHYTPEILESIGLYQHIDGVDTENIASTLTNFYVQITACNLLNTKITLPIQSLTTAPKIMVGLSEYPYMSSNTQVTSIFSVDKVIDEIIFSGYTNNLEFFSEKIKVENKLEKIPIRIVVEYVKDTINKFMKNFMSTLLKKKTYRDPLLLPEMFSTLIESLSHTKEDLCEFQEEKEYSVDNGVYEIKSCIERAKSNMEKIVLDTNNILSQYVNHSCQSSIPIDTPIHLTQLSRTLSMKYSKLYNK